MDSYRINKKVATSTQKVATLEQKVATSMQKVATPDYFGEKFKKEE